MNDKEHNENLRILKLMETKKDAWNLRKVCYPKCKDKCIFVCLDGYECKSVCPSKFEVGL
jgi:hypothetical protein